MGMRAVRRAIGTAFGALGIVFLLGGPPMALTRDWGALTVLLLPAIGIVMIDQLRVGGITEWRKVAAMAEAFNLPVVSHLVPEIHIQLMGSIPNGLTVEYMPWTLKLFEETPKFIDGCLEVPDKPGLGLKFSDDAFKQYAVSS